MAQAMLIGGSSIAQGFLNDAWILDTSGLASGSTPPVWTKVEPSVGKDGIPVGRGGHTTSLIESPQRPGLPGLLVIGGRNLTDVLSDVWVLAATSATTWQWQLVQSPNAAAFGGLVSHTAEAVTLGEAVRDAPTHVVVIGGTDGLGEDSGAVFALDLATFRWHVVAVSGDVPGKRHGGVSWPVGGHAGEASLELFGGQAGVDSGSPYLGDLLRFNLTLSPSTGAVAAVVERQQNTTTSPSLGRPVARVNAAVSLRPPEAGAVAAPGAWLFGGFSGYNGGLDDQLHNDLWAVSTL